MSYRNDVEALQLRLTQHEEELALLRRERARVEAASRDEPALLAQLDRLRKELHARAPHRLPVLDAVRVASPCNESWDAMVGDEHSRFCGRCEKSVYNLSSMTRAAAEALIVAREGKLCVRYYSRPDGTMLTADCPVGVRRKRVKVAVAAGAVAAMATGAMAAMAAYAGGQATAVGKIAVQATEPRAPTPSTVVPQVTPAPVVNEPVEYLGRMVQGDMEAPAPRHPARMGSVAAPRRR